MKEFNKHSLIEALASLPEYEPPQLVWEKVEQELSLQKNIAALDQHEPSSELWTNIKNELVLHNALAEMPPYEPPNFVWENIHTKLNAPKKMGRVVRMRTWVQYAAAAAIIGVLAIFGLNQFANTGVESEQLSFSVETVDDNLLKKDWNEDEDAFAYLHAICQNQILACKKPEFQSLQLELDELNDAKIMLEEAIGNFGTNPDLISEMKEIEFARTAIVKQMIDVIS